jgi:hypothetical protein
LAFLSLFLKISLCPNKENTSKKDIMEYTNEQKLFQTIVKLAWKDDVFKEALIENPLETIENLTGEQFKLPNGENIIVSDQTDASVIYFNIPRTQKMEDLELSDAQLEAVAGGWNLKFNFNSSFLRFLSMST